MARDIGGLFQGIVIERGAEGSDAVLGRCRVCDFLDAAVSEFKEEEYFVATNNFIPETQAKVLADEGLVGLKAGGGNKKAAIARVSALEES